MRRLAELGLFEPMSPLADGLVHMELHRGDGSLGTFYGVQNGLAMKSIEMLGSDEQKQRWLPRLASLDAIGAFALTEPDHGSDSVALETTATQTADGWVINGAKRWIGNGSIADVTVVWARDTADGQVKGFLVETDQPGYQATTMTGKGAARAIWQADIDAARRARRAPPRHQHASRTPAACSSPPAARAPGPRSATPSPPTTPRSPTPSSASSSASR